MRSNSGFTLIELILVTVIIGILAGAVALNLRGRVTETSNGRAKADIATLENAIEAYAIDNQDKLPKSLNDLSGGKRDYLRRKIVKDPWGNPYEYQAPGKHNKNGFDLFSRGADSVAGNEDDIANWDEAK